MTWNGVREEGNLEGRKATWVLYLHDVIVCTHLHKHVFSQLLLVSIRMSARRTL